MAVGSEQRRAAGSPREERPRAGRWVEGGRHAIGQAARGRSRGQRAPAEARLEEVLSDIDENGDVAAIALGGHEQMGESDVEAVGDHVVDGTHAS